MLLLLLVGNCNYVRVKDDKDSEIYKILTDSLVEIHRSQTGIGLTFPILSSPKHRSF